VGGGYCLAAAKLGVKHALEISGLERILDIYTWVEEVVGRLDPQRI
jgi:hypothetical protein